VYVFRMFMFTCWMSLLLMSVFIVALCFEFCVGFRPLRVACFYFYSFQ